MSVPLGEVRCRSLVLPISLSYRTTGIRVEEVASWVGLGWSLNAGGLITRTVRGQADETPETGYFAAYQRWRTADSLALVHPTQANLAAKQQRDEDVANGRIDLEPDTYSLSMAGQSATFRLDNHRQVHLNPAQEWRVIGAPELGGGWEVVLPNGVRYQFEAEETTQMGGTSNEPPCASAWHLTAILSPDGRDAIRLAYANTPGFNQVVAANKASRIRLHALPYSGDPASPAYHAIDPPFSDGNTEVGVNYLTKVLTRISAANTRLEFVSDAVRPDLNPLPNPSGWPTDPPGQRLTALVFRDVRQPGRSRRFELTYSLFPGVGDRLRLDAVQQIGQPAYRFRYEDPNLLPSRASFAQDHWGYFNGQPNSTLIPAPPASFSGRFVVNPLASANRAPNPAVMAAGVLTSVEYPTGGRTYFEYEANRVLVVGTEQEDSLNTYYASASGIPGRPPSTGDTGQRLDLVSQAVYDEIFPDGCCLGSPSVGAHIFTLPLGATNVSFSQSYRAGTNTVRDTRCELYKLGNGQTDLSYFQATGTQMYPPLPSPSGLLTPPTSLAPGTYVMFAATTELSDLATLEIHMHVTTGTRFYNRAVGGVRIRRMTDWGKMGDSMVTRYDYMQYDSTFQQHVSSGRLFFEPAYVRFALSGCAILAAADARTMSYAREGYHIGYDQVRAIRTNGSAGSTTYRYLNGEDANTRNLLLSETATDAANHVVKKVENVYSANEVKETTFLKQVEHEGYVVGICNPTPMHDCDEYYITGDPIYKTTTYSYLVAQPTVLTAIREKNYFFPSGGGPAKAHETSRAFAYKRYPSGTWYAAPSWERQFLGSKEWRTTYTTYACDYDTAAAEGVVAQGVAGLLRRGVRTAIVEAQQWKGRNRDSVLVGATLAHYQNLRAQRSWQLETAVPLTPSTVVAAKIQNHRFQQDGRYTEAATYERHDLWGNVQQERLRASRNSFLWDDDGLQLLAQVQQASYRQTGYTSFEPASSGRWHYDSTSVAVPGITGPRSYAYRGTPVTLDSLPTGQYVLSCWATSVPTLRVNGVAVAIPTTAGTIGRGGHTFQSYHFRFQAPAALNGVSLTGTAGALLDDLRLYPVGAQMQSYTHDPLAGVSSQTDTSGRILTYEYDDLGRLLRTRDEQGRVLSQQQYHYAGH